MSVVDSEEITEIKRRKAKSGRVSRSDPITLHETNRTRIVLVPIYITRSHGIDLNVRLVTYKKVDDDLTNWEEQTATPWLLPEAIKKLVEALTQHLKVAEHPEDGKYFVLRLTGGVAESDSLDPQKIASAIAGLLSKSDILNNFVDQGLDTGLIAAVRGAIRVKELRSALSELGGMLESGMSDEAPYQRWCEQHVWVFGNAYALRDDVRAISAGDKVDLLLQSAATGLRDIVELKGPDVEVLRFDKNHACYYFSHEVSQAIGQCHRYLDILHEHAAKGLLDHPQIAAYHPRATVIIGRSDKWSEGQLRALHGLNSRMHGITLMTYDQLLSLGKRLVQILSAEADPGATEDAPTMDESDELQTFGDSTPDDDMPF